MDQTRAVCAVRTFSGGLGVRSQIRIDPSLLAETKEAPSGENRTEPTGCVCPLRTRVLFKFLTLQSSMVVSTEPRARVLPSGEKEVVGRANSSILHTPEDVADAVNAATGCAGWVILDAEEEARCHEDPLEAGLDAAIKIALRPPAPVLVHEAA